jgi:ribonucleoside-triphosphate reductase
MKITKVNKTYNNMMVNRECYNSYFYPVENDSISVVDKFILHGGEYTKYLDGGSALHLNLDEYLTKDAARALIELSGKVGCNYFCTNVKVTVCNDCGYIDKKTLQNCSKCGSDNVDYATRVIGYLKKITSFSSQRQKEQSLRIYHKNLDISE